MHFFLIYGLIHAKKLLAPNKAEVCLDLQVDLRKKLLAANKVASQDAFRSVFGSSLRSAGGRKTVVTVVTIGTRREEEK